VLAAQRASGKQLVPHHQSAVGPATSVSAHMRTAGHPTAVDEVYRAPGGYGLTAGEHLTCLFEMARAMYLIDEDHYRPEVHACTDRIELVGVEGAPALEYGQPGHVRLCGSPTPHWHPAGEAWSEITLAEPECTIPGLRLLDPTVRGEDLWLVEEWVRALDEGHDHVISAAVGANTMEMIHGAYASHAEKRRVGLSQTDRTHPLERWLAREGRPLPPPAPAPYQEWIAWALAQPRRDRAPVPAGVPA
jgi:hypothetical protein